MHFVEVAQFLSVFSGNIFIPDPTFNTSTFLFIFCLCFAQTDEEDLNKIAFLVTTKIGESGDVQTMLYGKIFQA